MYFSNFMRERSERDRAVFMIPQYIVMAGGLSSKIGDQLIFKQFGLNTVRYALLSHLLMMDRPPKMNELKDMIIKSQSNMTQLVDSLENDGLVRRVPDFEDRRVNLIEITDKGRVLMEKVEDFLQAKVIKYFHDWDDQEIQSGLDFLVHFIQSSAQILGLESNPCIPKEVNQ